MKTFIEPPPFTEVSPNLLTIVVLFIGISFETPSQWTLKGIFPWYLENISIPELYKVTCERAVAPLPGFFVKQSSNPEGKNL